MLYTNIKNKDERYYKIVDYLVNVGVSDTTKGIDYIADILYMVLSEDDAVSFDTQSYEMIRLRLQGKTIEEIAKEFEVSKNEVLKKTKLDSKLVKFNLAGRLYPKLAETYCIPERNIKRTVNYTINKLIGENYHTNLYMSIFQNVKLTDNVFIRKSYEYLKNQGV